MADSTGIENTAVGKDLLTHGSAFSFLQAWRMLSRSVRESGGDPDRDILIRPALSMALPRAGVTGLRELPDDGLAEPRPRYELETGFWGLYGAGSPLPNFYTEDLISAEQEDEGQARQLLDLFHQRFYRLYGRTLEKYQPVYELTEKPESHFLDLLWSLVGLREPLSRETLPEPHLLLEYRHLFGIRQRSAAGLHQMLTDYLGGVPVEVDQCVTQTLEIPRRDRLALGMGRTLGVDSVMGQFLTDASSRLLIRIGPLDPSSLQALMNQRERWQSLQALVRAYVGMSLSCELHILLKAADFPGSQLGDSAWGRMGMTSWLGEAGADEASLLTAVIRLQ